MATGYCNNFDIGLVLSKYSNVIARILSTSDVKNNCIGPLNVISLAGFFLNYNVYNGPEEDCVWGYCNSVR